MRMSQRDRAAFLYESGREGLPIEVARKLLRYGTTLHRLAEAQCNGDWPADNGERDTVTCVRCECNWAMGTLKGGGLCPDCRTSDAVKALLAEMNDARVLPSAATWRAKFQGDPRGAVLRIVAPSGRELVAG